MRIFEFQQHLESNSPFTASRVHEVARELRKVQLLRHGHKLQDKQITVDEVATFLWVLFTNTTASSMQISLMHMLGMQDTHGFLDDFTRLLSKPEYLKQLTSVEITNSFASGCFAVITFNDGSRKEYGTVPALRQSAVIPGSWLSELMANVAQPTYTCQTTRNAE